jgi:hypothetical protein
VPRQVCSQQPVAVQQPSSGAGSAIGAIAGGILGNTIGHGGGRAAATVIGAVTGAVVGDNLENRGPGYVQNYQSCTTQTYYENRTVAYNVTYEYAGRQYTVQMPNDPGPSVRLQVTPVGATEPAPAYAPPVAGPTVIEQGQVGVPITAVYPAAYPAYPVYAPRPYYYPPISLSFGYVHHGGRGHWR